MRAYAETCTKQLMNIVDLVRGELTSLNRKTISALVGLWRVILSRHSPHCIQRPSAMAVH